MALNHVNKTNQEGNSNSIFVRKNISLMTRVIIKIQLLTLQFFKGLPRQGTLLREGLA